jgi:hypothetical protein
VALELQFEEIHDNYFKKIIELKKERERCVMRGHGKEIVV